LETQNNGLNMTQAVVTVKLTPTEHALAKELSTLGRFLSVSDVLRSGLMLLAAERKEPPTLLQLAQAERNQHEPRLRRQGMLPLIEASSKIFRGKERSRPDKSAPKKQRKEQTQCKDPVRKNSVFAHTPLAENQSQASDSAAANTGTPSLTKTDGESTTHGRLGSKATSRSNRSAKSSKT
jgi:Arc/MetJ-type ribon-helix-helix transcriptional regulator